LNEECVKSSASSSFNSRQATTPRGAKFN